MHSDKWTGRRRTQGPFPSFLALAVRDDGDGTDGLCLTWGFQRITHITVWHLLSFGVTWYISNKSRKSPWSSKVFTWQGQELNIWLLSQGGLSATHSHFPLFWRLGTPRSRPWQIQCLETATYSLVHKCHLFAERRDGLISYLGSLS